MRRLGILPYIILRRNMGGAGHGGGRRWDSSIYSEEIRARIEAGNLSNGKRWDEWGVFF